MGITGYKNLEIDKYKFKLVSFNFSTRSVGVVLSSLAILSLVVSGCASGSKSAKVDPKKDEKTEETQDAYVERKIGTGPLTVSAKDKNGKTAWTLKANSSEIEILSDKALNAELQNVYGSIYQNGKLTSTYKAKKGIGDQKTSILKLSDSVELLSPDGKSKLIAQNIEWASGEELLVARGTVKLLTETARFGPFQAIVATPNLKNIGTPDTMKQKSKWITGPLAAALAASAIAGGVVFQDNEKNFSVTNLTSWNAKLLSETTLSFKGAGKPFIAKIKSQGFEFRGRNIQGQAKKVAEGKFELDEVNISGGARAEMASKTSPSDGLILTSDNINLKAASAGSIFTLAGNVVINSRMEKGRSKLMLTAGKAVVKTSSQPGRPNGGLSSVEMSGRVKVTSNAMDAKGKLNIFQGVADRIEYNENTRVLVMIGNVEIDSKTSDFGGTFTADRVEVLFDGSMQVIEVNATGDPGTATAEGKP